MTTLDELIAEQVRAAVRDEVRDVLADLSNRPLVCTRDEAAHLLGVSPRLIDRFLADGRLSRLPYTKKVLIPRVAIEAFVQDQEVAAS